MNDEIPEWALIEAVNRVWPESEQSREVKLSIAVTDRAYRELAAMIAKYEPQPADPLIAEARQIAVQVYEIIWAANVAAGKADKSLIMPRDSYLKGYCDNKGLVQACLAALKRGMELAPKGWIKHDGKGRPVDPDTRVEVYLREGVTLKCKARDFDDCWIEENDPGDILFYRVLS